MDPHTDTAWHEVDEDGGFVVLSDEEEELQVVQEEERLPGEAEDVKQEKAVPGREDMLTGNVHCTNIELRTSKVLNSLMAHVI